METPTIALGQVVKEVFHMGNIAKMSFISAFSPVYEHNRIYVEKTFKIEKTVNNLECEIIEYLVKLSNTSIDSDDRNIIDGLYSTVNDIERVGDHVGNIENWHLKP